jgi:NAD(P)-dependent dehydrogenase (short-subunit alcohol dehydrogenase family)
MPSVDLAKTPSFRLDGRRALVTGGGRGIGLAAASALAAAGAHVTLAARTTAEVEEAAAAIRARGDKADAITLDVSNVEAAKKALAAIEPYQILINNAGGNRPAYLPDVKVEDFDFIFSLNVRAAFFMAQTVALQLLEAKLPGSIINISSQMATSALRGARSIAPRSTPWRASPRRWRSSSPRTTSASTAWDLRSWRRR